MPPPRMQLLPFLLILLLALPTGGPLGQEEPFLSNHLTTVRVELIQVYTTVVDRNGNPISDLTQDDFILTEDRRPMEIAVFDPPLPVATAGEPRPLPDTAAEPSAPEPSAAEPGVTVDQFQPEIPLAGRTYVVVFDGFNNPSGMRFKRVREATMRFVEERFRPGDRMAVIELRPEARGLTDLTSNKEDLLAALKSATFMPNSTEGLRTLIEASITDTALRSGDRATMRLQNLARFNQLLERSGQRAFYDSLTGIGNGLASLPGRKYLLLYSGGFPFLTATSLTYGIQGAAPLQSYVDYFPTSFRVMLDQLARSNTAIYSLNIGDDAFGADVEQSGNIRLQLARAGMDENLLEHMGLGNIFFGNDPFYSKQTLAVLAGETGGRFINVPDYDKALRSIDNELLAAYTLGYYPPNTREDGKFRKINVKVKGRPLLQVQHRIGYFAPKPYRNMSDKEREIHLADAAVGRVSRADLPLTAKIGYLPGDRGDTLATITLEVPLRSLSIRPGLDSKGYDLDVVLLGRDQQGLVVDSISKVVSAVLDPAHMPPPDGGLRLIESLTFPPGTARLNLVVRDSQRGAMTTLAAELEVPDFRFRQLAMSSLHLMTPTSNYAVIDEDFVPAGMRQRLVRQARQGAEPGAAPLVMNPFALPDGTRFQPAGTRSFQAGEELLVFLQVTNLGYSKEMQGPELTVTFDLKRLGGSGLALPSKQEAIYVDGGENRPTTIIYRLGLEGVSPGEYDLRATILDKLANNAVQGSEPIRVVATTATAATDPAGR